MSYTIVLVFFLELLGRGVNPWHLLPCLLVLALLYIQTQLKESAYTTGSAPAAAGAALPAAILCCVLAAFSTFQVYQLILLPNLPESEKFALLTPHIPNATPMPRGTPPPADLQDEALTEEARGETLSPPLKPPGEPIEWRVLLLICTITAVCIFAAMGAFKYLKFKKWLRKTLAAERTHQLAEFYRYFLRALALCGHPRQAHETPLEYLRHAQTEGFLLPSEQFELVTKTFLTSFYGGQEVSGEGYEACLALFHSLPGLIREKKGLRFYCLRYLRKMH